MANTIEYADSPNVDTAFVVQEGGQKNRAVLTAPQDTTTLELPDNPNSTKGYVTIDGKKHKVILTADISGNGGGGGGAVDSVNGKTGVVVLDATDVGAVPQYETMPTADASNADLIVQFVGATDTYTNGYFYKCTGAGEPVVYSWSRVDVQPQPVIPDPLPSQTGNNGKFLSTNGTTASWETVGGLPDQTSQSGKFLTTDGTDASWSDKPVTNSASNVTQNLAINCYDNNNTLGSIGISSEWNIGSIEGSVGSVNIGGGSVSANYAIQLGGTNQSTHNNPDANTFKVGNNNGNFEMMDANGNLPADRIADTTGLTAGNYLPRLTIDAQGNKTITWVAE